MTLGVHLLKRYLSSDCPHPGASVPDFGAHAKHGRREATQQRLRELIIEVRLIRGGQTRRDQRRRRAHIGHCQLHEFGRLVRRLAVGRPVEGCEVGRAGAGGCVKCPVKELQANKNRGWVRALVLQIVFVESDSNTDACTSTRENQMIHFKQHGWAFGQRLIHPFFSLTRPV